RRAAGKRSGRVEAKSTRCARPSRNTTTALRSDAWLSARLAASSSERGCASSRAPKAIANSTAAETALRIEGLQSRSSDSCDTARPDWQGRLDARCSRRAGRSFESEPFLGDSLRPALERGVRHGAVHLGDELAPADVAG